MANKIMKTLTMGENIYEIYDESARTDIATLQTETSQLSATIKDLKENGGGGNSVVETTKTVSVGTEAVTLENGIKEQEVNLVWNVQGAGSVPAFENYYIEKSNISYPRTFNANGYTQFWGDANYHGNSEKYVSGHEYLQVFHYTMDGDSVAVLNKTGGSPKYITPTNSENLTGSGWVYMLAKPTNSGAIVLNLTNTGTGTGTIDYLYCIDITALQENGTITATTINELAELFGELPLIPGQNFEGKTTDGTANLTITRDGVDTIVPSSETTANVKSGDVLKTDNGTVVFSVIAQVIISASAIWADKKWVAFGDSLTDEAINADKKYYRHIEEKTGINVVVMGKGGTGYYITQDSGTCFYQRMANVPSDADVITILGSINDWKYYQHSIEVGTATDTLEDGTLCGYMNKCIDVAIEKAPYSQIALISAPYYHGLGTDRQEELCTALQGVARHRRVKFLDLYHESGFRIDNPTFAQQYTTDYSETDETFGHPNNAFHEKFLAPDFMELLKRMLLHQSAFVSEGDHTEASAYSSHAEGYYTEASGVSSHAEGDHTKASGAYQHVQGKYNIDDVDADGNPLNNYAHIVGNGTSNSSRSNAHTVDWDGNANYAGDVYVGNANENKAGKKLATEEYVDNAVANVGSGSGNCFDIIINYDGTNNSAELTVGNYNTIMEKFNNKLPVFAMIYSFEEKEDLRQLFYDYPKYIDIEEAGDYISVFNSKVDIDFQIFPDDHIEVNCIG